MVANHVGNVEFLADGLCKVPSVHEQLQIYDAGHDRCGQFGEAHVDGALGAPVGEGLQRRLGETGDAHLC